MRGGLFAAVLTGAGLTGAMAFAGCNIDEAGLIERHEALAAEGRKLSADAEAAFRRLRATAGALDRLGFDAGCDAVVDAASRLLENEATWQAKTLVDAGAAPAETVGARNLTTLSAAGMPVPASELIGRTLSATDGRPLGTISDVLFDQRADASHVIVAHGGFWAKGETLIAVPAERLLADPGAPELFAEVAPTALTEAPRYDPLDAWDREANDRWYEDRAGDALDQAERRALDARIAERAAADEAMGAEPAIAAEPAARSGGEPALTSITGGPKRIRVEKDRPERAEGSND